MLPSVRCLFAIISMQECVNDQASQKIRAGGRTRHCEIMVDRSANLRAIVARKMHHLQPGTRFSKWRSLQVLIATIHLSKARIIRETNLTTLMRIKS